MTQIIMDHGVSGCFDTKLAPSRHYTATELTWPAQAVAVPQPTRTKHERGIRRRARLPLWMPYAHTIRHTFDTSQYTALSSDRLLPPARNPFRTAYTARNTRGIFDREIRTPESCSQQWSCTSVHSRGISECVQALHDGPPASNNARLFEYTSHGSPGKAEYTFASRCPCDALLEPTRADPLIRHRTMHNRWVRS